MLEIRGRVARIASLVFIVFALASSLGAKKKPQPQATQAAIVRGCVTVDNIYSQTMGWTKAAGVVGRVQNNCAVPVQVYVKAAFFDAAGTQLDNGLEGQTVAAHAQWFFFVGAPERFIHGFICDVKLTRIIEVDVFDK